MASTAGSDSSASPLPDVDPQLLFGVAQELAWKLHNLPLSEHASPEQSHPCRLSYSLVNSAGEPIARIPLDQLQEGLADRRRTLQRLLRQARIEWKPSRSAWYDAQQVIKEIKKKPHGFIALTWAVSTGLPYPRAPRYARQLPLVLLLLLLGVIPGLVLITTLVKRRNRYRQELEQLVKRWRVAGIPDPDISFLVSVIARSGQITSP
jgi:hypothetical protein